MRLFRRLRLPQARAMVAPGVVEPEPSTESGEGGTAPAGDGYSPVTPGADSSVDGQQTVARPASEATLLSDLRPKPLKGTSAASKRAIVDLVAKRYAEAEERLAERRTLAQEENLLGIAYAHLAHLHESPNQWQQAADAFARSVRLAKEEAKTNKKKARKHAKRRRTHAEHNLRLVESLFAIRGSAS